MLQLMQTQQDLARGGGARSRRASTTVWCRFAARSSTRASSCMRSEAMAAEFETIALLASAATLEPPCVQSTLGFGTAARSLAATDGVPSSEPADATVPTFAARAFSGQSQVDDHADDGRRSQPDGSLRPQARTAKTRRTAVPRRRRSPSASSGNKKLMEAPSVRATASAGWRSRNCSRRSVRWPKNSVSSAPCIATTTITPRRRVASTRARFSQAGRCSARGSVTP